jgi:hypothetical protein
MATLHKAHVLQQFKGAPDCHPRNLKPFDQTIFGRELFADGDLTSKYIPSQLVTYGNVFGHV